MMAVYKNGFIVALLFHFATGIKQHLFANLILLYCPEKMLYYQHNVLAHKIFI